MPDIVTYRGATYPWQCDHVGHMNMMWYVGKFDEASWNLIAQIGVTPSYIREGRFGMAGVQQNISYKRELMAGDVIEVRSRVLEVREQVIRIAHEMRNAERNEVAATCEITAVHLDRGTRKAAPFPPEVRSAAQKLVVQSREDLAPMAPLTSME